jgi:hypothetical protein
MASMFHLELIQVPHFILYVERWHLMFTHFLLALGYEYWGENCPENLAQSKPVNGCLYASVPSRMFESGSHAVLINQNGVVIHDPNPNQLWLGEDLTKIPDTWYWKMIEAAE